MDKTIPAPCAHILDFVRDTEVSTADAWGYEVIYGFNEDKLTKPITAMTIAELQGHQAGFTSAFGSSASGGYQIMKATLADLRAELGLNDDQLFEPDLQDRLGHHLARRRGYDDWIEFVIGDVKFGLGLAKEWASFPVLDDCQGAYRWVHRGQSYYSGDELNKALVPPERVEQVLQEARELPPGPIEEPIDAAGEPQPDPERRPLRGILDAWQKRRNERQTERLERRLERNQGDDDGA